MVGEIGLLVGIVAYSVAKMTILRSSGSELEQLFGAMGSGIDIAELIESATNVVYASVILLGFLYQGGLALYFRASASRPSSTCFT